MTRLVYVYACLFFSWTICPASWVGLNGKVSYLFAPGFGMSERHAAYYCAHYHASTGEIVRSKSSMEVLPSSCVSFNFPEVHLEKSQDMASRIISRIQQLGFLIHDKLHQTEVWKNEDRDTTIGCHWLQGDTVNLGQEDDVATLVQNYCTLVDLPDRTDKRVVLYGVSRGAATTFIFMGSDYDKQSVKQVKLVILEGCYDFLQHVFEHYSGIKGWLYDRLAQRFLPTFHKERIEPINFVEHFPKDIPVLLVTSKKDTTVANCCTKHLCRSLKTAGHENLYLLELDHSGHTGYFCHNSADVERYQHLVHALYKFYDLPYIEEYARQGKELLQEARQ